MESPSGTTIPHNPPLTKSDFIYFLDKISLKMPLVYEVEWNRGKRNKSKSVLDNLGVDREEHKHTRSPGNPTKIKTRKCGHRLTEWVTTFLIVPVIKDLSLMGSRGYPKTVTHDKWVYSTGILRIRRLPWQFIILKTSSKCINHHLPSWWIQRTLMHFHDQIRRSVGWDHGLYVNHRARAGGLTIWLREGVKVSFSLTSQNIIYCMI